MNKKIVYLFLLMILCSGLWWQSRPGTILSRRPNGGVANLLTAEALLSNDKLRLERNLKPEILSDKNWAKINDYSIEVKNLVNAANAKAMFMLTQSSAKDLFFCLKKDYCGMQRRNDNDSYFDEARTPAHVLLSRNLEIMLEALNNNDSLEENIDWDLIQKLTDNENEKVQVLALQMIKEHDAVGGDTHKLLEIAERYKGSAKAEAFQKLAVNNSPSERLLLINWLLKSFALDDPHSVISIIERMKKMSFTTSEVDRLALGLCHFRENGTDDPNWKMIKYYMSSLCDLEKICN